MRFLVIAFFLINSFSYTQSVSESDLQKLAGEVISENRQSAEDLTGNQVFGKDKSLDQELETKKASPLNVASSNIFGLDFISSMPTSITSSSDLPVPNDYRISINDSIQVILTGNKQSVYTLKVNMDGSIFIPEIGPLNVAGITIEAAKESIKKLVAVSLIGTEANIALGTLSAKKISIIGAVKSPGTYLVNPFTTLSNALAYSGGFEEYSSLRNIVLIRGSEREYFDLYDFLIYGDRNKDINIEQGDTILVQGTKQHLDLAGEVLRPKIYEYSVSDSFADIINFGMGFSDLANPSEISITEDINGRLVASKVELSEIISNRSIKNVFVGKKQTSNQLGIRILGNGVEERFVEGGKYSNLRELISEINFSDNLYPFYAKISMVSQNGIKKQVKSFSILDENTFKNVALEGNVEIRFFSREDIERSQSKLLSLINLEFDETSMSEKFSKENTQEDSTNTIQQFRITDLKVLSFGEFAYVAPLTGDIVPEKLFNFFGRDQIIEENLVSASTTNGLIERALKMTIDSKLLSQINFPEQKSPKFFLQISGQVNNPGTFTANTDMTLEDAYNLAGGLTNRADKSAIIFQRQSIKEREFSALNNAKKTILDSVITQLSNPMNNSPSNIGDLLPVLDLVEDFEFLGRLTGELSPGSSSAKTINLEPGDKIFVPAISSSVTVLGEVLQPLSTSFQQNLTFKDYLEVAGNLSTYADKSNMYIIKPDGTSVPIRYSEISKYYLSPGDTIIVPRNLEKLNTLHLISTSVKIISDIAFAAASLNILRN